ncbi:MAG: hypothetical protein IJ282_04125 [Lachnospiraceae bacterium]|nr:hypothetical protein [Lachnospiraceae bacterium]
MFQVFQEEKGISLAMIITLTAGIVGRIIIWILYQNMIKETDNMSATSNKLLKQCKLKFANCYQLNGGVHNVSIFVDKFLNRLALGPLKFDTLYHLCGQMVLLSVLFAGIGVCKSIIGGRTLGEILPFYIVSFASLYLYFSISAITDIKGQRRILKTNLVDYLENHMINKLGTVQQDLEIVKPAGKRETPRELIVPSAEGVMSADVTKVAFSKAQERELEELLKEFLKNA